MKNYNVNGFKIEANNYDKAKELYLKNVPYDKLTTNAKTALIEKAVRDAGLPAGAFQDFCQMLIENGKIIGASQFVPSAKKRKTITQTMVWSGIPDTVNF